MQKPLTIVTNTMLFLVSLFSLSSQPPTVKSQASLPETLIAFTLQGHCPNGQSCPINLGILDPETGEMLILDIGLVREDSIEASLTGYILYSDYRSNVHVIKSDGSPLYILEGIDNGQWSPDGMWIASQNLASLVIVNINDLSRRAITLPENLYIESFSWSSDSKLIALEVRPPRPSLPPFPIERLFEPGVNQEEIRQEVLEANQKILEDWENQSEVYLVDVEEMEISRLTWNNIPDVYPRWLPSQDYIAVATRNGLDLIDRVFPQKRTPLYLFTPLWISDTEVFSAAVQDENGEIIFKLSDLNQGTEEELFSAYRPLGWTLSLNHDQVLYTSPDLENLPTRKACIYDLPKRSTLCFDNLGIYEDGQAIWVPNPNMK